MAEVSVFDANSNTLTIPSLRVGTTYYSNAILKLPPIGQWSVTSIGPASFSAPAGTALVVTTTTPVAATPAVALSVSPTSVEAGPGEFVTISVSGGTPPYSADSSRGSVAIIGNIEYSSAASARVNIYVSAIGSSNITITDSKGNTVVASVKQNGLPTHALAVVPTSVSAVSGETIKINIVGGWPPYLVSSSRNFVAWPESGLYDSNAPAGSAFRADVSIHARSPGTATITVSDQGGGLQSVSVTVLSSANK